MKWQQITNPWACRLAMVLALASSARADFFTHYTIDLTNSPVSVNGIIKYEDGGSSWPNSLAAGEVGQIDQVFGTPIPRRSGFMIGLGYEGVTDPIYFTDQIPEATRHVVLMLSNSAATAFNGVSWSKLFPGYDEATLALALEKYGIIGDLDPEGGTDTAWADATALVDSFAETLKEGVSLDGTTYFSWFDIPQVGQNPTGFTVMEFSDGTQIGTGQAFQDTGAAAVPEPSSFALLFSALGVVAIKLRRK